MSELFCWQAFANGAPAFSGIVGLPTSKSLSSILASAATITNVNSGGAKSDYPVTGSGNQSIKHEVIIILSRLSFSLTLSAPHSSLTATL